MRLVQLEKPTKPEPSNAPNNFASSDLEAHWRNLLLFLIFYCFLWSMHTCSNLKGQKKLQVVVKNSQLHILLLSRTVYCSMLFRGLQGDVVYLSCPIASLVYEPKCGLRGGGLGGLSQWVQLWTWSPNKLWRSNSIFNLWWYYFHSINIATCSHKKKTMLSFPH